MALEIKENKGIFEILGTVSSQNLAALKIYFDAALENIDEMVVSLEGVIKMDSSSALFFEGFYLQAVKQNKVVILVGQENNKIANIMDITKTDYILSSDRI